MHKAQTIVGGMAMMTAIFCFVFIAAAQSTPEEKSTEVTQTKKEEKQYTYNYWLV
ncbi:MAG: hypothetical protein OXM61_07185 [Candidatus Poribacteria bacterium]|nr:hypothetical protein [Candidatus Poribacteria bacterium]